MRSFYTLLATAMLFVCAGNLHAQVHNHPPNNSDQPMSSIAEPMFIAEKESRPGYWGYRHEELHQQGVIEALKARKGGSCCSGEDSGECRVTDLRYTSDGRTEAYLDGIWCPISVNTPVWHDIPLIRNAQAVVCAGRVYNRQCPYTHCAAATAGL